MIKSAYRSELILKTKVWPFFIRASHFVASGKVLFFYWRDMKFIGCWSRSKVWQILERGVGRCGSLSKDQDVTIVKFFVF